MRAQQTDPAAGDAAVHPIPADRPPPSRPRPATTVCREARTREELAEHFRIRREVFVLEQSVFIGSDRDEHDADGSAIHLVGYCDGVVAGSVRLYELDRSSGLWKGDRLAVLPRYRVNGLGAPLVRCAVALAGARGGRTMVAHVQPPNVAFFTRLGWSPV
ncbi:MAG TPA: MSMEG_0567/Sll0786 family nitrogen starvation N-acetyltransferase, partial [Jiangellaceae bacterium]